jgi:hypothetical protein
LFGQSSPPKSFWLDCNQTKTRLEWFFRDNYFIEAKPKPLLHAASEKDPLVTIGMQQRTLDRVKRLNGCNNMAERWAENCQIYPSKTGTPVIVCLHDEGHRYPEWIPAVIVRFFKEHSKQ